MKKKEKITRIQDTAEERKIRELDKERGGKKEKIKKKTENPLARLVCIFEIRFSRSEEAGLKGEHRQQQQPRPLSSPSPPITCCAPQCTCS